jgi:hypothetical protein
MSKGGHNMHERLSIPELEATSVELLPARETLALFNVVNVTAVNIGLAVNAASLGSAALASANQLVVVDQT